MHIHKRLCCEITSCRKFHTFTTENDTLQRLARFYQNHPTTERTHSFFTTQMTRLCTFECFNCTSAKSFRVITLSLSQQQKHLAPCCSTAVLPSPLYNPTANLFKSTHKTLRSSCILLLNFRKRISKDVSMPSYVPHAVLYAVFA